MYNREKERERERGREREKERQRQGERESGRGRERGREDQERTRSRSAASCRSSLRSPGCCSLGLVCVHGLASVCCVCVHIRCYTYTLGLVCIRPRQRGIAENTYVYIQGLEHIYIYIYSSVYVRGIYTVHAHIQTYLCALAYLAQQLLAYRH